MFKKWTKGLALARERWHAHMHTREGLAEVRAWNSKLQEKRKELLERTPLHFEYVHWAVLFGVVDYARQVSTGLVWCGLVAIELFLGRQVQLYFSSLYPPFGAKGINWSNFMSLRAVALLGKSVLGTVLVLAIGFGLSTAIVRSEHSEIDQGSVASASKPATAAAPKHHLSGYHFVPFAELSQEAQAAWAQAILSVLAIGVAIWLPLQDRKRDRSEKKRREIEVARDLALVLLPDIVAWDSRLAENGFPQVQFVWAFGSRLYVTAPGIRPHMAELHLLGPAADGLQKAVFLAREMEVNTDRIDALMRGEILNFEPELRDWENKFVLLRAGVQQAVVDLKGLFDADRNGRQ